MLPINVETIANTAIIKFNLPEIKNPLSVETLEILRSEFFKIEGNEIIDNIIFTGSGDTFASGANLKEVAKLNERTAYEFGNRGQNLMQKIFHSSKRIFAVVDGFCMGGALDLAISCDVRIASPNSIFAHPGTKLGIITGWSGTQILPRLIGKKNALELFLTGKKLNALEARRIGLIDEIAEDPLAKTLAIISQ